MDDDGDYGDEEVPWASPEIQQNYEAALGRFMLAFNRLDNLLGEIIETVLVRLGRQDLVNECVCASFDMRLRCLDLLRHTGEGDGIQQVPIADIKAINGTRNALAHGHFEQNPFSGSYTVVGRRNSRYYSAAEIDGLAEKATTAWAALRHSQLFYLFSPDTDA
jgi:hypothetical protein